jgi:hypothetical protein
MMLQARGAADNYTCGAKGGRWKTTFNKLHILHLLDVHLVPEVPVHYGFSQINPQPEVGTCGSEPLIELLTVLRITVPDRETMMTLSIL